MRPAGQFYNIGMTKEGNETVDEDVEASWQSEIALRIQELDSGKAKTVPWTEVRNRLSAKLSHGG